MTTINNDNILTMFEEINLKLDKTNQQIEKMGLKEPEATGNEDITELKSAMESFHESQSEKLENIGTLIQKEKRKIEFTPTSTFGMAFFFSLMLILLTMAVWNYSLRSQNSTLSDNDLKYRYILIHGETTPKTLSQLENIFENNSDSTEIIRKQVESYEKNLMEEIKLLNKARLKEQEAEQLKQEAESYKRK